MNKKTILIVEDDIWVSQCIKESIEHLGYKTICVHSVENALKQLQEHTPDLILADIGLPDGTGIELAEKVLATKTSKEKTAKRVPFVIITGDIRNFNAESARELNVLDFIPKPFDSLLLAATLDRTFIEIDRAS